MSIQSKLNRFKKHLVPEKNAASLPIDKPSHRVHVPQLKIWEDFQTTPYYFEEDYCLIREVAYPLDELWGKYRFSELYEVMERWQQMKVHHPLASEGLNPGDLLFFDTETTGLSGGSGNTIFLLGSSKIDNDEVKVKQYFLPQPGSEIALYHYFLTQVNELKNLVTYNGKSFDWPQVKTRHTLIRDYVPSLPAFGHYDLLHGARRLWKHVLPSVRLSIVEKEILGVFRENDVPGYLAPMLYFQFLNEGDPQLIQGVMKHNEWDVLSLITLYIHMSKIIQNDLPVTTAECFELARWLEALGETEMALTKYEEIIQHDSTESIRAKKAAAFLYKKMKKYDRALKLLEELCEPGLKDEGPWIELAKLYEHHKKDYEKALYYAKEGFSVWKSKKRLLKHKANREQREFEKRIERIEKKCRF
ncbi:ribonuclease H-like domain-containing protein [Fictibacillus sp. Mic-4]|uniref:ribonuclease H-like domain-containing protein n=1 Tax=Fictibacillus TaxID=1329200 RepID=UPI000406F553|nr:ribonuclease H-like domain-containing protein [Fictibacillus gelatini]